MANKYFYPPIEPFQTGALEVDAPHTLYWEQCGNPDGEPVLFLHGRYDVICPVKSLLDLARAWPELDYEVAPQSGHSSHEPEITHELVAATNRIVKTGSPQRT